MTEFKNKLQESSYFCPKQFDYTPCDFLSTFAILELGNFELPKQRGKWNNSSDINSY